MKLRRIVPVLVLMILSLTFITANAEYGSVNIITAMQTGEELIISGSITNAPKGLSVGLIIYDTNGQTVYFSQTETGAKDSQGIASFSFPVITTDVDMDGYSVFVSADGYQACSATIERINENIFYVSANASDDSGDGSYGAPFKTITAARNAVRAYKTACNGNMEEDVIVYIREGTYVLNSTLTFNEKDSGTNGHTVTYCAYPGETPKIVAAKHVFTDWALSENGVWVSSGGPDYVITGLTQGIDKIGIPARVPNALETGDAYLGAVRVGAENSTESKTSFSVKAADNVPEISDISSLYAVVWPNGGGWYNWTKNRKLIKSVSGSGSSRVFNLDSAVSYTINNGSRYYLEGALEFLDAPGEFYYDKAKGTLKFIPPVGFEISKDTKIYAHSNFNAISIIGSSEAVKNFRLSGLDITGVGKSYNAVYMKNADSIEIYGCRIHDLGGTGIKGHDILSNTNIEGNEIFNMATGITLVSNVYSDKVSRVSYNIITNNHIYDLHGSDAGIEVAEAAYNKISHNRVHGSDRMGIWVYGASLKSRLINSEYYKEMFGDITEDNVYEFMRSHDNTIEYNDVYDCMKDSQDGGPIYTSRSHHNIIRYNNIHDSYIANIGSMPAMNGLYLDDDSDFNEVYGNSVYNISGIDGGYLSVALAVTGRGNVLTGNIVANNGIGAAKQPTAGVRFYGPNSYGNKATGNIYYNTGTNVINSTYSFGLSESDNNILYNSSFANPQSEASYTFTIEHENLNSPALGAINLGVWRTQRGYDINTVAKNPMFMDEANDDFRFGIGSPAIEKDFTEIYRQDIGLKADYPYAQIGEYDKLFISIADEKANPGVIKLAKGASAKLNTLVRNNMGYVENGASVTFVSDNTSVVTVGQTSGIVTAISAGTAKITAYAGNITTDVYITVYDNAVWLEDMYGTVISEGFEGYDSVRVAIDTSLIYERDLSKLMPMAAAYSKDGLILFQSDFKAEGAMLTADIVLAKTSETPEKIKVFLWEKGSLTPKMSHFEFNK